MRPASVLLAAWSLVAAASAQSDLGLLGQGDLVREDPAQKAHVFVFRDDIFRFDSSGVVRDLTGGPDSVHDYGGAPRTSGSLRGRPVYRDDVHPLDATLRIRVVLEPDDPGRDDLPELLVLTLPDARAPGTTRRLEAGRVRATELETFAHEGGTYVNAPPRPSRLKKNPIRLPAYEARVPVRDVFDPTVRGIGQTIAFLGGAASPGAAHLRARLLVPAGAGPAGAPGLELAESPLTSWIDPGSQHRRGYKTAGKVPLAIATADGRALARTSIWVRDLPDWIYLTAEPGRSGGLAPMDLAGSSLAGEVELMILDPVRTLDDSKEAFGSRATEPNRFYLVEPAGYWFWRGFEGTLVGFRTAPSPAALAAALDGFVAAARALARPEHPPAGKSWILDPWWDQWHAYSQRLAGAWLEACRGAGADGAAIDSMGAYHHAGAVRPRVEWEPQGAGSAGVEVLQHVAWELGGERADRLGIKVSAKTELQQRQIAGTIPELVELRKELVETFRSNPPETLALLFDRPAYASLWRRTREREAKRLAASGESLTAARAEELECDLRFGLAAFVVRQEYDFYVEFRRMEYDSFQPTVADPAVLAARSVTLKAGFAGAFPVPGDTFDAAVLRAYDYLSPPFESGERGYLGPLVDRTDGRARKVKADIQRELLRTFLAHRDVKRQPRALFEFFGVSGMPALEKKLADEGRTFLLPLIQAARG